MTGKQEDFTLPLTHLERMDEMQFKAAHEKELARIQADRDVKVAKERRREERQPYMLGGIVAVCVAAVLGVCAYAWWIDEEPVTKESYATSEAGREEACYQRGGGWIPGSLIYDGNGSSDHGVCVFPGRRAG